MIKGYLRNSFLLFAPLFLAACSDDMSRSKAKEVLIEHYKFPIVETQELDLGNNIWATNYMMNAETLEALAAEKIITLQLARNRRQGNVNLTESGKKLVQGESKERGWPNTGQAYVDLPIAKIEFIEVTGLVNRDEKTSIVEYTWKYVPYNSGWKKPIADLAGKSTSKVHEDKSILVLYDDGWRVKEMPKLW